MSILVLGSMCVSLKENIDKNLNLLQHDDNS